MMRYYYFGLFMESKKKRNIFKAYSYMPSVKISIEISIPTIIYIHINHKMWLIKQLILKYELFGCHVYFFVGKAMNL